MGHAVDLIIEACLDAGDAPVTLCPLGPLTNIGMAIAKEPRITAHIREIAWMGGAFDEAGNTTPLAEFNAFVDPHAAHIVFTAGVPLTIFPLDVTHRALMTPTYVESLRARGSDVALAAAGMVQFYEQYDMEKYDIPGAPMHDPCVIAYLIEADLFTGREHGVTVDHTNEATIGNTEWDERAGVGTATVMTDVDADAFFNLLVDRIGSL